MIGAQEKSEIGAGKRQTVAQYCIAADAKTQSGRPMPPLVHLLRKYDYHGVYRRVSVDLQSGTVKRDANGEPLYDQMQYPVRRHLDVVPKGFELVELLDGAPAVEGEVA